MAEEADRMTKIIQNLIENKLVDVHTGLPARVVSVNTAENTVNVQPCLKRKYADNTVTTMPVIENVPLAFPRTANAFIILPVAKDDYVWLWFSERSLDNWLDRGGFVDPEDTRKFNISDAVAFPGVFPKPSKTDRFDGVNLRIENGDARIELGQTVKVQKGEKTVEIGDSITITNGQASFVVQSAGKFKMQGPNEEFLSIIAEFMTIMSSAVSAGPGNPLSSNPAVAALLLRMQTLIGV